jgi:glycosyltransferase involved in cell wall biosynthesis
VGILWEKQGLQVVLDAMPRLYRRFPKVHLTVIGTGEYESMLKRKATSMGLNKKVAFLGFIRNHREIEDILTKAGVGLAPYKPDPTSVTYFADPAKIKLYLGCGLPIITTSVPAISKDLEKNKAGLVMPYTSGGFYKAVLRLLGNVKLYSLYRNNAIEMSKEFDIDRILTLATKSL